MIILLVVFLNHMYQDYLICCITLANLYKLMNLSTINQNILFIPDMSTSTQLKIKKLKTNSGESLKGQLYFRIVPKSIKFTSAPSDEGTRWLLYLQKGMQVLGKSVTFQISPQRGSYQFDFKQNKFDFQIASDKNLNYTWAIYSVDGEDYEERVGSQRFSIKQQYEKYEKDNVRGHDLKVNLKKFVLSFKLFIQNTTTNIMELVNEVVPENLEDVSKALAGISKKGGETERSNIPKQQSKQKEVEQKSKALQDQIPEPKAVKKYSIKINPDEEQNARELYPLIQPSGQPQVQPLVKPNKQDKLKEVIQNNDKQKKMEEIIEEESSVEESRKKIQSKSNSIIQNQHTKLEEIEEDKQREDLATPMATQSKFTKPGSMNDAIAEIIGNEEQIEQKKVDQPGQPKEQAVLKYETATGELKKSNQFSASPTRTRKSLLKPTKNPTIVSQTSGNKLKKVLVVILFLILIGGIIGTAVSGKKQEEQQEEVIKKPQVKKKTKKSK